MPLAKPPSLLWAPLLWACLIAQPARADTLEILVRSGDSVVSGNSSFPIANLKTSNGSNTAPILGEGGHTLYQATLVGPITSADRYTLVRRNPDGSNQVIARSGFNCGPGQPLFSGFSAVNRDSVMNNVGEIVFPATLAGAGITSSNDGGYWRFGNNSCSLLAQEDSPVSGLPGVVAGLSNLRMAREVTGSWVSMAVSLQGAGINSLNNGAIMTLNSEGALESLAAKGSQAPGTLANFFAPLSSFNKYGDIIVHSSLTEPGNPVRYGIWSKYHGTDQLNLRLRTGDSVPYSTSGEQFTSLYSASDPPKINSNRSIGFVGLKNNSSGVPTGGGIWLIRDGIIDHIASTGMSAPDLGFGTASISPGPPVSGQSTFYLNDDDSVFFWGLLNATGLPPNTLGLFLSHILPENGQRRIDLVLHSGMHAPGQEDSVTISAIGLGSGTWASGSGDIYLWVRFADSAGVIASRYALVRWSNGTLKTVIRNGDSLPGLEIISLLQPAGTVPDVRVNERGDALFLSGSHNTITGSTANLALWRVNRQSTARGIYANGVPIQLSDGTSQIAGNLSWSDHALNKLGRFTFVTDLLSPGGGQALFQGQIEDSSQCRADFNQDEAISVQDLYDYLSAWIGQNNTAEFDGVAGISIQDLFDFLEFWFAGCQ